MDFIVSRIAMSVCALLVIGILAGVVDGPLFDGPSAEIEDAVKGFCRVAEEVAGSRAEVELDWTVPSLLSGDVIRMTISCDLVSVTCAGSRAVAAPACEMRMWTWDGSALNESLLSALDGSSEPIEAVSGDVIVLRSMKVECDGLARPMLFVAKAG